MVLVFTEEHFNISCLLFSLLSFQPIMKQCSQKAKAIFAFSLFAILAKTNPQVTLKYRNYNAKRHNPKYN